MQSIRRVGLVVGRQRQSHTGSSALVISRTNGLQTNQSATQEPQPLQGASDRTTGRRAGHGQPHTGRPAGRGRSASSRATPALAAHPSPLGGGSGIGPCELPWSPHENPGALPPPGFGVTTTVARRPRTGLPGHNAADSEENRR